MPRFRSSGGGALPNVGDYEPAVAKLVKIETVDSEYEERGQLHVTWLLNDGGGEGGEGTKLQDWISFRTGAMPGGKVAKLRQLLNTISGQPLTEEPWIDDDTLEFGYGDPATAPVAGRLDVGLTAQLRGRVQPKNGVDRYQVEVYEPVGGRRPGAAPAPAAVTPPQPPAAPAAPAPVAQPVPAAAAPPEPAQTTPYEDF